MYMYTYMITHIIHFINGLMSVLKRGPCVSDAEDQRLGRGYDQATAFLLRRARARVFDRFFELWMENIKKGLNRSFGS